MNRAGPAASTVLDRVLVLEMVRVTDAAAIAASKLTGRGDETAADHAAVEAMRATLNELPMDGTVVIGEITDGALLAGVHRRRDIITTESIVMRASSGTVRRVTAEHHGWAE